MTRIVRIGLAAALVLALALPAAAGAALPPVNHVFVIVLENKTFADTFGPTGQANAPYLNNTLLPKGELLTRYYGIGHNSADNYIAMISGQPPTAASKNDCPDPLQPVADASTGPYELAKSDGCDYPARFRTIGDQLTAHGMTWKGYNSGIPSPCSMVASSGNYARKHNPWVFFRSLRDSGQCRANDVGTDQLATDLQSVATTPNFSFIVPDQCEDGHNNCTGPLPSNPIVDDQYGLQQSDAFLSEWVPRILNSPAYKKDGLLIVTFDESVGDSTACCNEQPGPTGVQPGSYVDGQPGPGGGVVGAVLVSKWITPGSQEPGGRHLVNTPYNHYSLLRSLEDIFGLPEHLGYAAQTGLVRFGNDVFDRAPAARPSSGGGGGTGGSRGSGSSGTGSHNGGSSGGGVLGQRHASCSEAPRSAFGTARRRSRLSVRGRSTSRCRTPVRVVQVALARRSGRRCRWLTAAGHARKASSCTQPLWVLAHGGGNGWQVTFSHVTRGRYLVSARAIDAAGRRERARSRTLVIRRR